MRMYVLLLGWMIPLWLSAQLTYEQALTDGIARFEALDFEDAIKKFEAAEILSEEIGMQAMKEVHGWLNRAQDARFNALSRQLAISDSLRQKAEAALKVRMQLDECETVRMELDSALAISDILLNSIFWYEGRFGLTIKNIGPNEAPVYRYGFIDRAGHQMIPYEFEEATPFSTRDGFSRVVRDGTAYLLSTDGKKYRLANTMGQMDAHMEALDLVDQQMTRLSKRVTNYPGLKILLLAGNQLQTVVELIKPLTQLTVLDLRGNPIKQAEIKAIQGMLPNCDIKF